ncbi:hypothetical protein [Clostridium drakei]|nr:hypothetical protein [Clostridium drakei]
MKFKLIAITEMITTLLFIIGVLEILAMFMKIRVPTVVLTLTIILSIVGSMSEFVKIHKLRKLAYPLIIIYCFIIMPVIGEYIHSKILNISFAVLSFIVIMIFIYKDLIITNKENNSLAK